MTTQGTPSNYKQFMSWNEGGVLDCPVFASSRYMKTPFYADDIFIDRNVVCGFNNTAIIWDRQRDQVALSITQVRIVTKLGSSLKLLCLLLLTPGITALSQTPIDHTAMTRGPISFGFLQNPQFIELATLDRDGVRAIRFRWTADSGEFSYDLDDGAVLHGRIRKFKLEGIRTELQGTNVPTLEIKTGQLSFEFTSISEVKLNLYGGVLTIPVGSTGTVSNTQAINIKGPNRTNQIGRLQLAFSSPLAWRDATFQFPRLPTQIKLNLSSQAAVPTLIDVPFSNGKLQLARGRFSYNLPAADAAKTVELVDPTYRANLRGIGLGGFIVDLQTDKLTLQAQNLSVSGEITARVVKSEPIPVLFSGKVSAGKLGGSATFSEAVAQMENLSITDLRLDPSPPVVPPIAQNAGESIEAFETPASGPSEKLTLKDVSVFLPVAFSTRDMSPKEGPFPIELMRNNPFRISKFSAKPSIAALPQITNTADFYTASPWQARAIEELEMSTLTKRQRESIRISHQSLQNTSSPTFLVNYPRADFRPLLDKFLRSRGLKLLEDKFGPQEALLLVDVVNSSNPLKLPESVKFVYRISPTIEKRIDTDSNKTVQDVVLRYSVALARIDQTKVGGSTTPDAFLAALDSQVTQANAASEAENSPVRFPLPVDLVEPIDLNKSFTDPETKARITLASKKTEAVISATSNTILVDEVGIHVMGFLEIDPTAAEPSPTSTDSADVAFSVFKAAFQQKVSEALSPESLQTWEVVSAHISKAFVSRALAAEFNKSEIQIAATFPNQRISPQPSPLPLNIPRDESNCDECHHCSGGGPGRWVCEGARGACMVSTAPVRILCEAKKALVNLVAGNAGRVEFSEVEALGILNPTRLNLAVNEDLSGANLNSDINVFAAFAGKATLKLNPVAKALTLCPIDLTFDIPRLPVTVSTKSLPFRNRFERTLSDTRERIDFQLTIEEAELDLGFPISPLVAAVGNNLGNFVTCPLPTGIIGVVGVIDQVFHFNYRFKLSQNFTAKIGGLSVTIPGRPKKVELTLKDSPLSVGFAEAAAQ